MKKETILFVVIALVIGVLIGVIVTNSRRDVPTSAPAAPPVAAPAVNQQQQTTVLEEIVAREPTNRNAWVRLGHNFFDANQPMKAINAYAKALELNDRDPDVLTDQGVMYRRVGWFDKAISNFEKAHSLDQNHRASLYNLGIVYRYDLQDFAKAKEVWTQFVAIDPGSPGSRQAQKELDFLQSHPQLQNKSQ
jgi:cytochrome c-type biogenesis protein CcmH/NrfG